MAYEIFGNDITEITGEIRGIKTDVSQDDSSKNMDKVEGRNAVLESIRAGRTIDTGWT